MDVVQKSPKLNELPKLLEVGYFLQVDLRHPIVFVQSLVNLPILLFSYLKDAGQHNIRKMVRPLRSSNTTVKAYLNISFVTSLVVESQRQSFVSKSKVM
jgi:hypothetical protein